MSGVNEDYNAISSVYSQISKLPLMVLERQLVAHALSSCKGQTILDLGGGNGIHARKALELGASSVDVVDISSGMLKDGKTITAASGVNPAMIRWFEGDISSTLAHLPLHKSYDVILVGWTFDHAETEDQLLGMWRNVTTYAATGAKLINTRLAYIPKAEETDGIEKYGFLYPDYKEIPGGISYTYEAFTDPPLRCPATSLTNTLDFDESKSIARQHGFRDYQVVDSEQMDVVKEDPAFWRRFVDQP
ncbi:hypothetical protein LTR78_004897 [Recurvomyces mirabilis]|uniref:Methyltransferase domain-containing protein n=1 Tax=Recurvomyces mirabilis TaxID=574656 RepID=A0AAE0WP95_9PEZI|nr:hypothetical protein LTR78_004897 [Recurvomyces mirabilis]KAK5158067.1 hypothetical protein LTS14_003990 [Recurvomyces mirabilis]